jgi:cytochrome P450
MNPNLPDSEKSDDRLIDEARVLLAGGTDTTAHTLASITYHLLANPSIFKKLKKELEEAIPDPHNMPVSTQIEALPYLTAVIQEGIRLHPGASLRQERVAPDESLIYEDVKGGRKYVIPKGVSGHFFLRDLQSKLIWNSLDSSGDNCFFTVDE